MTRRVPTALTIAGSDSGGGAGIQADLKTFVDHEVFGMSVITAITAQNSRGVTAVGLMAPDLVTAQLRAVFDDFPVDAIKIGMLGDVAQVDAVIAVLKTLHPRPPIVLDPVMVATTGARLLAPEAIVRLREGLVPLCQLVTPNLPEQALLGAVSGVPVLVTGGDADGAVVVDRLLRADGTERRWEHPRRGSVGFHGTGCTLSSAIAAAIARGADIEGGIESGIAYVQGLLAHTEGHPPLGSGHPSLLHGFMGRAG